MWAIVWVMHLLLTSSHRAMISALETYPAVFVAAFCSAIIELIFRRTVRRHFTLRVTVLCAGLVARSRVLSPALLPCKAAIANSAQSSQQR